ncbi:hypothetical protein F4808DRAFT_260832 [Astrocystis sublimbata]|nr:hypothetical protein F4808DRAFT_260832 [Astrocystis sublimbata]
MRLPVHAKKAVIVMACICWLSCAIKQACWRLVELRNVPRSMRLSPAQDHLRKALPFHQIRHHNPLRNPNQLQIFRNPIIHRKHALIKNKNVPRCLLCSNCLLYSELPSEKSNTILVNFTAEKWREKV